MRKLLVSILFLLLITPLKAQFNQGLYTFRNLPLNRLYNPSAEILNDKEILIPLVSHVQAQTEIYGFSIQEIYSNEKANETIESFIKNKNGKEHFWANDLVNLFYYGFRDESSTKFWSFGVYQETQSYGFYPTDLVDLFYNGNELDRSYNVGDLRSQALALTVYHAGLTYKPKNSNYTFGGRIKLYNALATVDATHNKGTITTIKEKGTNEEFILIDGSFGVRTSGLSSINDKSQLIKNSIFSGNMGLGIDLGATYTFNKNWSTSISLIDIGTIYNTSNISNTQVIGTHKFEGVIIHTTDDPNTDFWQKMIDQYNADVESGKNTNNYFSIVPPKLFASVTYTIEGRKRKYKKYSKDCSCKSKSFFTTKHYFTFSNYNKLLHNYWDWALGVSYMGEINSWFGIQANYLFSPYDKTNIGAGVSFRFYPVLIYVSVDNIPGLLDINNAHSYGLFAGINIVLQQNK